MSTQMTIQAGRFIPFISIHRVVKSISKLAMYCCFLLALSLSGKSYAEQSNNLQDKWLSAEQIQADVKLLERAFERVHPGYDRYTELSVLRSEWQGVVDQANEQGGMRLGDFYLHVQSNLAMVRCDHTKAELPEALKQARKAQTVYLPFRWRVIEGRAFVEGDYDSFGLQTGDEIVSWDGRDMTDLIDRYTPMISVDGHTDHVRYEELGYSSEFMGGAIEHFEALSSHLDVNAKLVLKRKGKLEHVSVEKLNFDEWRKMQARFLTFRRNFKDEVSWHSVGDNTAVLNVNTFVNYRQPVDPMEIYGPIFEDINRQGKDALIIDLRKNGGGSTDAMRGLLAHLIQTPVRVSKGSIIKSIDFEGIKSHLGTWDQRALNPQAEWFERTPDGLYMLKPELDESVAFVQPATHNFKGKVAVLTSHTNASGVTNLLAKLKDMGRITTIGQNTGGNVEGPTANILFFVTLPESGVIARLPAQRVLNDLESLSGHEGIAADIHIPATIESFQRGEDVTMKRAESWAASKG